MAGPIEILGTRHSKPKIVLPKGATDCHTHIFGPAKRYPYADDRAYTPPDASLADLKRLHQHIGIDRVVIVHPSPYGTDNQVTLDALLWLGENARAVAVIPAALSDEDISALDVLGVRGVRLNLATAGVTDIRTIMTVITALAPKLADNGWHLQLFTSLSIIDQLADFISTLPITVVFDHFGGAQADKGAGQAGFRSLTDLLKSGQAYVKISAGYRISARPDQSDVAAIAETLIAANPDRVIWGTDWPHPGGAKREGQAHSAIEPFRQVDDGAAVDRLAGWAGSAETLYKILVQNPARLYGF